MDKNNQAATNASRGQEGWVEVTDPAEKERLRSLGKRYRAHEARKDTNNAVQTLPTEGALRVLELCRQLAEGERLPMLRRLAALLSPEDQLDILDLLIPLLPEEGLKTLEQELLARANGVAPATQP